MGLSFSVEGVCMSKRTILTVLNVGAIAVLAPLVAGRVEARDWVWVFMGGVGIVASITWLICDRPKMPTS